MSLSVCVPYETPATVQNIEKIFNDIGQPSSRVQQLKRELTMEIKYYRQKCVQLLKKSMVHYAKLNSTNVGKHSSTSISVCSEFCCKFNHVNRRRIVSTARAILSATIDSLCFNLILSMFYMIFFLYKDSLSNAITPLMVRGIITNNCKF